MRKFYVLAGIEQVRGYLPRDCSSPLTPGEGFTEFSVTSSGDVNLDEVVSSMEKDGLQVATPPLKEVKSSYSLRIDSLV